MDTASVLLPRKRRYPPLSIEGGRVFAASATTGLTTAYVRADIAYARSFLTQTHLKGTIGEFFAERYFLNNQLEQNIRGNWVSLNPRTGPQGLDHLFLKAGKNGKLYWMVGESKYGSSQLGTTVGGVRQLSSQWTTERIHKLGQQYSQIATQDVSCKSLPHVPPKVQLDIPLKGKTVSFWKDANNNWYFSGSPEELHEAQQMAQKMGNSLLAPNCNFRVRLFHVEAVGNDLKITLYQVKPDEVSTIGNMKPSSEFYAKDILGKHLSDKEFKKAIAQALKNKFPDRTDEELRELADDITKKYKSGEFLRTPRPVWQTVTLQSLAAAGISAVMDVMMQLITTHKVQLGRTAVAAGSTGLGTASGQVIGIVLLKSQVGNQMVRSISSFLNVSTSMTRTALSGLGGGVVTSLLLSYGLYFMGYSDIRQANRSAIIGTSGALAGTCAAIGIPTLVAQFATAATGTAISTLSGAAATNATLAWLGGGTVASGGLGVAGGAVVLGGIVAVVAISVSLLISMGFAYKDISDKCKYALLLIEKYNEETVWRIVAEKSRIPKQSLAFLPV